MPILEATASDSLLSEQRVLECVSDDPNAFFLLWPSYQHDLYHACLSWMGNQQDAEDALSEIALKAWKRLPKYADKITNLKGWLTRLSYNHCMDIQLQRQKQDPHQVDLQTMIEAGAEIVADSPLPQEMVLKRERSDYLCQAITFLPEHLREVVILRFWQDRSIQQIADQIGLTLSAVSKRLQKARAMLLVQMSDYLSGDSQPTEQAVDDDVTLNRSAGTLHYADAQVRSKERAEIKPQVAVIYCAVQVTWPISMQPSVMPDKPTDTPHNIERTFILPLRNKPTRVSKRLRSLQSEAQRYPTGWKKQLQLADFCYAIGRWEEAIDGYYWVVKKQPHSIELYLQLGQILRLLEREEEAITVYENALSQARQESTRHHLRGLISLSRRDYTLATTHLEAATKLAPDNGAHWHLLGQICLTREAYQEALRAYDMALELNPDDLIALSESYEPLVAMGHFAEALERVRRTLKLAPRDLHAVKRLTDHRSRMGLVSGEAYKQTKKLIRIAREMTPQAAYTEATRATYYLYRGKSEEGVAVLEEMVEKHPLNPDGWYHYALCLFQSGDPQQASEAIQEALALRKDDYRLYRAACDILPYAGVVGAQQTPLQPLVKEMLERFPERWSAWSNAGRVLLFLDDERGCTLSAKATKLQPQLAEPWLEHGRTLALAGEYRQAIEALSNGYQYIPQKGGLLSVRASVWLAESYQKLGDKTNCRKWREEAARWAKDLVLRPLSNPSGISLAMAHYWQGRALEGLGSFDAAIQAYRTALDLHLLYPARQDAINRLKVSHKIIRKFQTFQKWFL